MICYAFKLHIAVRLVQRQHGSSCLCLNVNAPCSSWFLDSSCFLHRWLPTLMFPHVLCALDVTLPACFSIQNLSTPLIYLFLAACTQLIRFISKRASWRVFQKQREFLTTRKKRLDRDLLELFNNSSKEHKKCKELEDFIIEIT